MKTFIFLIALVVIFSSHLKSQPIQNGGFENWTVQNLFDEPNGFMTSNNQAYKSNGIGNVTKVTDSYHGLYAAKLETVQAGSETAGGMILIGTPGNQSINGGLPYTGTPDSISGWVKYDIQPNDTAFFIVAFKKGGVNIGQAFTMFYGTQSTYKRFSIPTHLNASNPPDTLTAIITCSKMDPPRMIGSTLTIDSISFLNSTQPFPNGSFEEWTPIIIEEPDNWTTLNIINSGVQKHSVTKTTDSYEGNYAIRVESVQTPWGDTLGFITNGVLGNNGPEGGMAVSANPKKISGYYKYFPIGLDTAFAGVTTYKYDSSSESTMQLTSHLISLTAASSYTYFEIPLGYNLLPVADTVNIFFAANNMENSVSIGSVLFLDSLNISYYSLPVGIQTPNIKLESGISIYPNPIKDKLNIISIQSDGIEFIKIYDVYGEMVKESFIKNYLTTITISELSKGLYLYQITDSNGIIIDRGKFIKE
jgi:hypothetical protein